MKEIRASQSAADRRAFTITELMISVAVLVVVILAASKIFQTAGRVASVGEASADLLQEATSIERQLRADIANLASEGFFAIQCVSVRNDVNGVGTLLNPNLPPDARIRCDQLVFFRNGVQSSATYRLSQGENRKGQGVSARVYYGHAFQVPEAGPYFGSRAKDVNQALPPASGFVPWATGAAGLVDVNMTDMSATNAGSVDMTQPEARQWLLVRQPLLMVDDDLDANPLTYANGQMLSGRFIYSPEVLNNRVDAVTQQLAAESEAAYPSIREELASVGDVESQRDAIAANYIFYPRAERSAPSMSRVDQALTNSVISSSCSSFKVDWCYAPGVGEVRFPAGGSIPGVHDTGGGDPVPEQEDIQWFGLLDYDHSSDALVGDVRSYRSYARQAPTIFEDNIESDALVVSGANAIWGPYNAIFGFNQDKPFLDSTTDLPVRNGDPAGINIDAGYTPWPTAIRVTMTLHDPRATLEGGREFQFIIKLPDRVN